MCGYYAIGNVYKLIRYHDTLKNEEAASFKKKHPWASTFTFYMFHYTSRIYTGLVIIMQLVYYTYKHNFHQFNSIRNSAIIIYISLSVI